jgi:hypothetical protein
MLTFLLFLLIAWLMTAAGRSLVAWLRLPNDATLLERTLIGFAVGLGLLAYGMLLLGLAGGFYPGAAVGLLAVLLLLGGREHGRMVTQIRARFARGFSLTPLGWGAAVVFLLLVVVALSGVYAPPTLIEWDSVAYHLADPKLYVQAHRIYYLPWEDHSNFAFNLEMCYTLGLLFHSIPLAKLFHFACGVCLIAAVYRLGTLLFSSRVALWGALLLASCPIVFWEAGTAYVDLAVTFYATLTLLALTHGVRERSERWLWIGAVLMGLTLSTKGTALGVLGLLTLGLLAWRCSMKQGVARSIGLAALWCVAALAVGSPWYIKAWVYTGNPVYPFFSHLFGGRYWSVAAAGAYDVQNASFGAGRGLPELVLAPWNLTMSLLPGHFPFTTQSKLPLQPPHWAFNDYQTPLMTLTPVLAASLLLPLCFVGRIPMAVKALATYSLASLLVWFVTAQHVRYLLPILPVFCLLAGWVLDRALAARLRAGRALAGLTVCSIAFSLFIGGQLLMQQLPVDLGAVSRDSYIAHGDAAYPAMQYINTQLPQGSKIVFYGNPLGFYCDKPYLWGEPGHSTYVSGAGIQSPEDLRRRLAELGVTHILVNTQFFTLTPDVEGVVGDVYALTVGSGPPIFGDPSDPRQHVFLYALPVRTSEGHRGILKGTVAHSSSPAQDAALLGAETGGSNPRWARVTFLP